MVNQATTNNIKQYNWGPPQWRLFVNPINTTDSIDIYIYILFGTYPGDVILEYKPHEYYTYVVISIINHRKSGAMFVNSAIVFWEIFHGNVWSPEGIY